MKKIHLIINGLNGSEIKAQALVFSEENNLESCGPITYNDSTTNEYLLNILDIENGEIYEHHVGGRPNDRRKK